MNYEDIFDFDNIKLAGVDMGDDPDFSKAKVVSASYKGTNATTKQIDWLNSSKEHIFYCTIKYILDDIKWEKLND